MEKTNEMTAANAVPPLHFPPATLARTYEAVTPYLSSYTRQVHCSAYQLAKATRLGYEGTQHLIMGILSSESPIMREVRSEFMVTAADVWTSLREMFEDDGFVMMCNRPPMTPRCKQIFYAAFQTAHEAHRKARVADFLVHFFDDSSGDVPHDGYVLGVLADFDLTQAAVVSFIRSREHLEPPMPPDPPAPPAPRPEPRVWKSATDRYADWRIRLAATQEDPPASQK
ncbi:hypothetical protein [Lacipirellula parvula]|uniref:Clp R domain-containing protein n=1 Tax=Lacipirellula parvula TaxID=2650471 RepID=A0A5K7XKN9_9BACT|nr:hypothetical protein [Lacipirellula parvula]BBO35761.1 hypothetical protein PLANPX_5373 [Lacipirellula parvula]